MKIFCEVAEGGLIPGKHLGLYRHNYDRATSYFMLMPFNRLARLGYDVWMWCRFACSPSLAGSLIAKGYDRGYNAARKWTHDEVANARAEGVRIGREQVVADMLADLDRGK